MEVMEKQKFIVEIEVEGYPGEFSGCAYLAVAKIRSGDEVRLRVVREEDGAEQSYLADSYGVAKFIDGPKTDLEPEPNEFSKYEYDFPT